MPLDHHHPDRGEMTVFAREVVSPDHERDELPWMVFFQGGPGFEASRPVEPRDPTWLERALQDHRVLLLDQRGTGRSSPIGSLEGRSAAEQAEHLALMRADSIVRDAECIRRELDIERWTILGQSFGGFCATAYLSIAPEGLSGALIAGGLPPLDRHVDDVYTATYRRVLARNEAYYGRYPEDRERVRRIIERLDTEDVRLPSGDRLSSRRFRMLGQMLGMGDGFEKLHYILELPFGSRAFLHDVEASFPFTRNPLYVVVHEACYATGCVTRWSAERVMPQAFRDDPTLFTGEHVFPWMLEECAELRPLSDSANMLAEREWPRLYDPERLLANEVPAAAVIYAEDMYVERAFSEETASRIRGLRPWITNEYDHDGLRADGPRVLGRLLDLVHGRA